MINNITVPATIAAIIILLLFYRYKKNRYDYYSLSNQFMCILLPALVSILLN